MKRIVWLAAFGLLLASLPLAAGTVINVSPAHNAYTVAGYYQTVDAYYQIDYNSLDGTPPPTTTPVGWYTMGQVGGYNPALLGAWDGMVPVASIETFAGMTAGQLLTAYMANAAGATVTDVLGTGSAIQFAITTTDVTGTDIQFDYNFVSAESVFNDFAFYSIGTTGSQTVGLLGEAYYSLMGQPWTGPVGWATPATSGYTTTGLTGLAPGSYTLTLGVMNVGDGVPTDGPGGAMPLNETVYNSALLLDAVPEPATFFFTGSALLGAALVLRRKRR